MKVSIIAALSADGQIAPAKGGSSLQWTSTEDTKFFTEKTREAGVVIMGRETFETIGKPLPGRLNIVYSHRHREIEGVEATDVPPADLISDLEKRGYEKVAVIGGTQIYTLFLEAEVVTDLYLTVEPVLFGAGQPLFNTELLGRHLTLESMERMGESTVLLHYTV